MKEIKSNNGQPDAGAGGTVRMEFDIDPEQGAAAIFGKFSLPGHQLVRMDRKGTKVILEFEKVA